MRDPFQYSAVDAGYFYVKRDGIVISQHTSERKAVQRANAEAAGFPNADVTYTHEYTVRVVGSVANQGAGDTEAPTVPAGLSATAINKNRIDLSWTASTDNVGVAGYQVFRDGSPLTTVDHPTTVYSDTGVSPSTLYSYTVAAYDAAGNTSAQTGAEVDTTPANAAPVWSAIPDQELIVGNSISINLNDYISDADAEALTFTVETGTLPAGVTFSDPNISGTSTTAGESLAITVRADDGNDTADAGIQFDTYDPDVTAPPVPANLTATPVSANQVDVSWDASTDVIGAANEYVSGTSQYHLYRDSGLIVSQAGTTYSDTGLSVETAYDYQVAAEDNAVNVSSLSAITQGTTLAASSLRAEYQSLTKYYIDYATGSDTANDGLTEGAPFKTPYKYAQVASPGSIGLFKTATYPLDQVGVQGSANGRPLILHSTTGASAASPIVFANYPGHSPIFQRTGSVLGRPMVGAFQFRSGPVYDGIDLDGGGGHGRVAVFVESGGEGKIKHCNLHNVQFAAGSGEAGAGSNFGLIYGANTPVDCVIEHNNFYDMRTTSGNANEAAIMVYYWRNWIVRYNNFYDLDNYWLRCKNPATTDLGSSDLHDIYFNHIINASGTHLSSATRADAAITYQYGKLRENLIEQSGFGLNSSSGYPQNAEKDWEINNNTFIDAPLFAVPSDSPGPRGIYDTRVFNNISSRTTGSQINTNDTSSYSFDYEQYFYLFDYNGYALPNTANWNHGHTAYPGSFDEGFAAWQARTSGNGNGLDANSILTTDAKFVNAAGGDYRLASDSPFKNAGRSNGLSGGTAMDMGCFANDYWLGDVGPNPM